MPKQESKEKIITKLHTYLDEFNTIFVCEIKDLPANNIHNIRKELREKKSEVLCGKTVSIYTKSLRLLSVRLLTYT